MCDREARKPRPRWLTRLNTRFDRAGQGQHNTRRRSAASHAFLFSSDRRPGTARLLPPSGNHRRRTQGLFFVILPIWRRHSSCRPLRSNITQTRHARQGPGAGSSHLPRNEISIETPQTRMHAPRDPRPLIHDVINSGPSLITDVCRELARRTWVA